jgi:hypothetical protein
MPLPSENAAGSKPKRPRKSPYRRPPGRPPKHGGIMLTRILRTVPLDTIDRRSSAGVYMRRIREDLTDQLGGDVSPARAILIEEAAKTALIVKATGDFILRQSDGLVRDGELLPVVVQREALVNSLARLLVAIGLERRAKPVPTLEEYIAAKDAEEHAAGNGDPTHGEGVTGDQGAG